MPSGLTHIILTRNLPFGSDDDELRALVGSVLAEISTGSVAPDLPYASRADEDWILSWQDDVANLFHHHHTNEISLRSLKQIRDMHIREGNLEKTDAHFGFFAGYASHVIADGIFHPFIMDKVGRYVGNESDHRALELSLDVLVYEHFTQRSGKAGEIRNANIQEIFNVFLDRPFADSICKQFSLHIDEVYKRKIEPGMIKSWVIGIHRLFDFSTGDWPSWIRGLDLSESVIMRTISAVSANRGRYLELRRPKNWSHNFLGGSHVVHFIDDCVPRFNEVMMEYLRKAYFYVYNGGPEVTDSDLAPFSLDTGRLLAEEHNINRKPALWS